MAGISAYQLNKYHEAITYFQKTIQINPENYNAYFFKAWSLYLTEKYDEALDECHKAYDLDPENEILYLEGSILLEQKEYQSAREFLELYTENTQEFDETYADAIFKRAITTFHQNDDRRKIKAINLLDKALTYYPENAELWNIHGLLLNNLSQKKEAISSLEKATILEPDWAIPFLNLAKIYQEQNQTEQAMKLLETAEKNDNTISDIYYCKSLIYKDQLDYHNAKSNIAHAMELNMDNIDYSLVMGQILIEQGMEKEGERYFQKIFDLSHKYGEQCLDKYFYFPEKEEANLEEKPIEDEARDIFEQLRRELEEKEEDTQNSIPIEDVDESIYGEWADAVALDDEGNPIYNETEVDMIEQDDDGSGGIFSRLKGLSKGRKKKKSFNISQLKKK